MEWEEFTGFVIDQVLALTREAQCADRLRVRSLGARDKPSVSRYVGFVHCLHACRAVQGIAGVAGGGCFLGGASHSRDD